MPAVSHGITCDDFAGWQTLLSVTKRATREPDTVTPKGLLVNATKTKVGVVRNRPVSLVSLFCEVLVVKPFSKFGYLQLSRMSKPACDRRIYQLVRKHRFQSFVEVGLADGQRCENLLRVALTYSDGGLRYTGIDLFDDRPDDQTPLKLIDRHRVLNGLPAKVQLVPGSLSMAIQRIANSHLRTDLMIVSAGESNELEEVIRFVPRMLHSGSILMRQQRPEGAFELLTRLDVERWASRVADGDANRKAA